MDTANSSRDILEELFSLTEEESDFDLDGLDKIIHRQEPEDRRSESGTPPPELHRRSHKKHKATHYLSEDVSERLEHTKQAIGDLLAQTPGAKVSKSRIVNIALRIVLEDHKKDGNRSRLMAMLASPPGSHHMKD